MSDPLNWNSSSSPYQDYDVAQICLNGHVINRSFTEYPEFSRDHCAECGAATINCCQECSSPIRGSYTEGFPSTYSSPKFCEKCGKPYPWTNKSIQATKELAEHFDGLDETEKGEFIQSLQDVASENPRRVVATEKLRKILAKLGKDAYNVAIKVISDVATEATKKSLGL